jgi:hypothetical protein
MASRALPAFAPFDDEPAKGVVRGNSATSHLLVTSPDPQARVGFTVTIGKAARAGAGWYLILSAANDIGDTATNIGPKTMGTYFEIGSVDAIDWGTVQPGAITLASAADPNGNNVPTASTSSTQVRTIRGLWANTGWGLSSRITSFSSTSGWSLSVAENGTKPATGEFAMRCAAQGSGNPADESANYLSVSEKNLSGGTAKTAFTTSASQSLDLRCQLLNGSANAASYTGTVIVGIGPN